MVLIDLTIIVLPHESVGCINSFIALFSIPIWLNVLLLKYIKTSHMKCQSKNIRGR